MFSPLWVSLLVFLFYYNTVHPMPGKYSYGAVLTDRSSPGIIYLPEENQHFDDHLRALGASPLIPAPQSARPKPASQPGTPSTTARSFAQKTKLPNGPAPNNHSKTQSINYDMPGRRQDHAPRQRTPRLVLDWDEDSHDPRVDGKAHRAGSVQPRLPPDPLLITSFDPDTEKEVYLPQPGSQLSGHAPRAHANVSKSIAKPFKIRTRNFQPRDDVESFQQFKYRGAPLSPALSHDGERLFSVQEFLDSSPDRKEAHMASQGHKSTLSSSRSYTDRGLPRYSVLSDRRTMTSHASLKRPSIHSFEQAGPVSLDDSSDEDGGVAQSTPATTVRNLTSGSAIWSDDAFRRRKIMDLTRELHILSTQGGRRPRGNNESTRAEPVGKKGGQARSKQPFTISDMDDSELSELDGFEIRPLRRQSTRSSPQPNNSARASRDPDPLFLVPDDQLSPLTPYSTRSLDFMAHDVTISDRKHDIPNISHEESADSDYFSGAPLPKPRMQGQYYRNSDKSEPENELRSMRAMIISAYSGMENPSDHSDHPRSNSMSAADMSEPTPRGLFRPHTRSRRQTLQPVPSFTTTINSQAPPIPPRAARFAASASRAGSSTPPFGVPSIVRSPEQIAAINAEARRRAGAQPRESTNASSDFQTRHSTDCTPSTEPKARRYRLAWNGSRTASLSQLKEGWIHDRKGSLSMSSRRGSEYTPTKLKKERPPNQTKTISGEGEQPTPKQSEAQIDSLASDRAASLRTRSLGPLSMNPPHHRVRLNNDSDPTFDLDRDSAPSRTRTRGQSRRRESAERIREQANIERYHVDKTGRSVRSVGYEHYVGDDDLPHEQEEVTRDSDAALPPPDISRERYGSVSRGPGPPRRRYFDEDRMETIFRVLQDGPGPQNSSSAAVAADGDLNVEQGDMPIRATRSSSRTMGRRKSFLALFQRHRRYSESKSGGV